MEDVKAQVLTFAQEFAATTGLDVTAKVDRDEPEGVLIGFHPRSERFSLSSGERAGVRASGSTQIYASCIQVRYG